MRERGGRRRTRILVVEDEESLADTVRYNLEREGYVGGGRRRRPAGAGAVPHARVRPW